MAHRDSATGQWRRDSDASDNGQSDWTRDDEWRMPMSLWRKKSKTHTEEPIDPSMFSSLVGAAEEAAAIVDVSPSNPPDKVVAAIDEFVFAWQGGKRPPKKVIDPEDAPYAFGSLWGQQLVRKFGWEWKLVTFHEHDDSTAAGVLSPDRSLAVYPIHFVIGCLQDSNVDCTILLSYNMLKGGDTGDVEPGSYFIYMDGVQAIVPRTVTPAKPWWRFW